MRKFLLLSFLVAGCSVEPSMPDAAGISVVDTVATVYVPPPSACELKAEDLGPGNWQPCPIPGASKTPCKTPCCFYDADKVVSNDLDRIVCL